MTPFQPIPEGTQVHVDRLLGAQVGDYRVLEKVAEGRFGTLYRAQESKSGEPVTLEVLRAELVGNDEEARAANAIRCAGIAEVQAFGQLPDDRRYRVMESLDGESLEQLLQRGKRFEPREVVRLLIEIAGVLQAAHAWAITHGGLRPSNVLVIKGAVKVIDFGLMKSAGREDDLQALGALGFALLTGKELEGAPPAIDPSMPDVLDRLLRELLEKRLTDATSAKRQLEMIELTPVARAAAKRSPLPFVLGALVMAAGIVTALFFLQEPEAATVPPPPIAAAEEPTADPLADDDLLEAEEPAVEAQPDAGTAPRPPHRSGGVRAPRVVPSAQTLQEETTKLESKLRKRARPGDDIEQALYVLNKQRLRLTGSPSEAERREVAKQLAGWRRSYLR